MGNKRLCNVCIRWHRTECMKLEAWGSQGDTAIQLQQGELAQCIHGLPSGGPGGELPQDGPLRVPDGYRKLDDESFLPEDEQGLSNGAIVPSPDDESMPDG